MTNQAALVAGASPRAMFHAPAGAHQLLRGPQVAYSPDEGGALTVDQATEALLNPPLVTNDPAEPEEAPQAAADGQGDEDIEISADETSDAADASEAEQPGDGEDETDAGSEAAEPLTAPVYWSKDAKAKFAELSPELQEVVLAQEGPREAATAKAKAEAAEAVKAVQQERQGVQTLAEQLETFLPEALETFQQRWGDPDWEATIKQYGAEQAALLKARYDKEQGQLQQLAEKTRTAQQQAHQARTLEEFQILAQLDPELAPDAKDPKQGSEKRQEVTKYLLDLGVARDAVAQISAVEMSLARKAMLWDRAQDAAKTRQAQPKPATAVQRKPTPRPGARPGSSAAASPQSQGRTSVQNAFNAKPSVDNAVALLMARSKR